MNLDKEGVSNYNINLCCLCFEFKVSQQIFLYKLTWETSLMVRLTTLAFSSCIFSSSSSRYLVKFNQTTCAYSKIGLIKDVYIITLVNVNAPVVATTSWWLHFSAQVVP